MLMIRQRGRPPCLSPLTVPPSLNLLVVLVLVIILGYLWLTVPHNIFSQCSQGSYPPETHATRSGAYHQLILFIAAYMTYIALNE
jgi:hypothetical protein